MSKARVLETPLPLSLKYRLYEAAVQDPKNDSQTIARLVRKVRGKEAYHLREDFCGTFAFSCAWVKRSPRHRAIGIDLDPEPLSYGLKHHFSKLTSQQQKRLQIRQQNVLQTTTPAVELVVALNFSYWIFKLRGMMKRYFRTVHQSLKPQGCFVLDLCGGREMFQKNLDRSRFRFERKSYTYLWEQKDFDPSSHESRFAIHFRLPNGKLAQDTFTYDWRIWTIPELKDILLEVGFREVHVFYEDDSGVFREGPPAEDDVVFISYIVAKR